MAVKSSPSAIYRRFRPLPALQPYLESIWLQECPAETAAFRQPPTLVLPAGAMEIAFHYADPFDELVDDHRVRLPRAVLTGQKTTLKRYLAHKATGVLVVRVRPWAAPAFFDSCVSEARDRNVHLNQFLPCASIREMMSRLQESKSAKERVDFVQAFLLHYLRPDRIVPAAKQATLEIRRHGGAITIRRLASAMSVSVRHLERTFTRQIGLTPKQFARIQRFQRACALCRQGWRWPDIIDESGFYDQSHFIHEFKSFSGITPEQFTGRMPVRPLARFFNAKRSRSPFYNTIYL